MNIKVCLAFMLIASILFSPSVYAAETFMGIGNRGLEDGDSETARFTMPQGLARDSRGGIWVLDTYNNALRVIRDGVVETLTGSADYIDEEGFPRGFYVDGELGDALLNRPVSGVFCEDGVFFFADSRNHVIRHIVDGRVYTFSGTEAGHRDGVRDAARFNTPMAVAVDGSGNIIVADTLNNVIRRISANGRVTTIAGMPGREGYQNGRTSRALFRNPAGLAVSECGDVIYVADTGNHVIRRIEGGQVTTVAGMHYAFDVDGYPLGGFYDGAVREARFNLPRGLVVVGDVLVVADSGNHAVRVVSEAEVVTLDGDFHAPMGLYYFGGYLYVADSGNNMIRRMGFEVTREYRHGYRFEQE